MDSLAGNHEKLRVFCGYLHTQIVEQNTVIKEMGAKLEEMCKKVETLETNTTLTQLKISTVNDDVTDADNDEELEVGQEDELELKLLE